MSRCLQLQDDLLLQAALLTVAVAEFLGIAVLLTEFTAKLNQVRSSTFAPQRKLLTHAYASEKS